MPRPLGSESVTWFFSSVPRTSSVLETTLYSWPQASTSSLCFFLFHLHPIHYQTNSLGLPISSQHHQMVFIAGLSSAGLAGLKGFIVFLFVHFLILLPFFSFFLLMVIACLPHSHSCVLRKYYMNPCSYTDSRVFRNITLSFSSGIRQTEAKQLPQLRREEMKKDDKSKMKNRYD